LNMQEIQGIARLKIHPGKLDEFKRLSAKCMELVRTKDKGTLQYESYLNADGTECLVLERYRDSQALLDHFRNMGETMVEMFQVCTGFGEVCGIVSPELRKALEGGPVRIFTPFLSL
jgi:quinol monooxygenase YgiN